MVAQCLEVPRAGRLRPQGHQSFHSPARRRYRKCLLRVPPVLSAEDPEGSAVWRTAGPPLRNRTVDLLLTIGIRSRRQPGISPEGQVRRSTSARLGEVRDSSRRMRPPKFLPTAGGGGAHARSRFHPRWPGNRPAAPGRKPREHRPGLREGGGSAAAHLQKAAAPRPGTRHATIPGATQLDGSRRTPQDDTAAARWSLGRGNALVPWSWQMTRSHQATVSHDCRR